MFKFDELNVATMSEAWEVVLKMHPFEFIDGSNRDAHMTERKKTFLFGAAAMYVLLTAALNIEDDDQSIERVRQIVNEVARLYGQEIKCPCPDCVEFREMLKKKAN